MGLCISIVFEVNSTIFLVSKLCIKIKRGIHFSKLLQHVSLCTFTILPFFTFLTLRTFCIFVTNILSFLTSSIVKLILTLSLEYFYLNIYSCIGWCSHINLILHKKKIKKNCALNNMLIANQAA